MRNFERLGWIVLVALFATLAFQKQPVVTLAAPPKPAVQVVSLSEKPCLQITHRINPKTGQLERVGPDDPLGIRPARVLVEGKDF